jgi:serine/threonine protein kinase
MMKAGFESEGPGSSGFEPPPVDLLSELFPQLEILELVGKGGMGAVYKARQPSLDRLVAIKVLPPEVGRDPAFADRFAREARAMARLSHPNIVGLYEFGETEGFFYFMMEYVDGANLRQTMQAGKLKPEEALAIVPQICDALQFAHDEGVVHRDIKPENVLIDLKGRVKIADFGLAKLLGEEQLEVTLTHTNQVMGTFRYMAPEQMQATHDVDHRADIYSLGVVFYELLTGKVPMGRFDPPSRKVQIDVRLDQVVLRALAQEPDKRYQHASEVKTDVEALAGKPVPPLTRKPNFEDGQVIEFDLEAVRQEVMNPAMGLVVVGVLTCLTAVVPILLAVKTSHDIYDGRITLATDDGLSSAESSSVSSSTSEPATTSDGLVPPDGERPQQAVTDDAPTTEQRDDGVLKRGMSLAGWLRHAFLFAMVLLLPSVGIIIAWGGWMMKHLQSRGLAVTASILALLPCQPVFVLGPIFGIWSLIVLSRSHVKVAFKAAKGLPPITPMEEPEEEPAQEYVGIGIALGTGLGVAIGTAMGDIGVGIAIGAALGVAIGAALSVAKPKDAGDPGFPAAKPPTADFKSSVSSRLKVPAIGLLVAGTLNLLAALVVILTPIFVDRAGGFDEGAGFIEGKGTFAEAMFLSIIIALCSLASGIMLLLGAARMFDLQSHSIALFAAVVAIVPIAIGFPISLPFGIWALLVLSRQDVKSAFANWTR